MKKLVAVVVLLLVAAWLLGLFPGQGLDARFERIQAGMTQDQVRQVMGEPDSFEKAHALLGAVLDASECWSWGSVETVEDGEAVEVPAYQVCFDAGDRVKSKRKR